MVRDSTPCTASSSICVFEQHRGLDGLSDPVSSSVSTSRSRAKLRGIPSQDRGFCSSEYSRDAYISTPTEVTIIQRRNNNLNQAHSKIMTKYGSSRRSRRRHHISMSSSTSAAQPPPSTELRVPPPSRFSPNKPIDLVLTWTVQGSDPEAHKNDVLVVNASFQLYKIQSTQTSTNQYIPMAYGHDFATASTVRNPCSYSQGFYQNEEPYRRYDFVWRDVEVVRQGNYYLEFVIAMPPPNDSEPGQVVGSMASKAFRVMNDASGRLNSREQELLEVLEGKNHAQRGRNVLE